MAEPHRIKGEGISFRDGRGLLALGTRRRRLHSPASKGFLGWDFQGQPITEGSPTLCSLGKGEMGGAEPPAAPWGWGARPTAPPPHQLWSIPSWQLLSRCFRAWQHLAWRRWAVAAALALGRRQLLRRGLQALRWMLWLRDAQLNLAWRRHTQALLARSFQKVRVSRLGHGGGCVGG